MKTNRETFETLSDRELETIYEYTGATNNVTAYKFELTNIPTDENNNANYCPYDFKMIHKGIRTVVEVKTRNIPSTKYDTTFIELDKFTAINKIISRCRNKEETTVVKGMLVVKFNDGHIYEFNLENICGTEMRLCPKNTAIGNNNKVWKCCASFNMSDATKIK